MPFYGKEGIIDERNNKKQKQMQEENEMEKNFFKEAQEVEVSESHNFLTSTEEQQRLRITIFPNFDEVRISIQGVVANYNTELMLRRIQNAQNIRIIWIPEAEKTEDMFYVELQKEPGEKHLCQIEIL